MLGQEAGEDNPEFPAELDELLEYCIGEHGDDFDAISRDFLDIASDLEDSLADRAQEFFSPDSLRRRWLMLCGIEVSDLEAACEEEAQKQQVSQAAASGAAASIRDAFNFAEVSTPQPSAAAASSAKAPSPAPAPAPAPVYAPEPPPSGFSIFQDSLKGQISEIYQNVQRGLPSVTSGLSSGGSPGSRSDDESDEDTLLARLGGGSALARSARGLPAGADDRGSSSASPSGGAMGSQLGSLLGSDPKSRELRQQAMKLFGTDDVGQIFSMPDRVGEGFMPVDTRFEAAAELEPEEPRREDEDAEARSDGSEDSIDVDFAAARRAMKNDSAGFVDAVDSPTARAARQSAAPARFAPPARPGSSSSSTAVSGARPAKASSPAKAPQKFVHLKLVDSSGSEEEDEEEEEEEVDQDAADGLGDDPLDAEDEEPLRVTAQLLRLCSNGECPWDTWTDYTRRWPRLHLELNSPDFFRRGTDLRVRFDVDRLKQLRIELQEKNAERKKQKEERAARYKRGAAEFIKEAEKRRAMIGNRFTFVLKSTHQEKEIAEEKARKDQEQKEAEELRQAEEQRQKAEEEEAKKRKEKIEAQKAYNREVLCRKAEEARRKREEEAARVEEARRVEAEKRAREARVEELWSDAQHQQYPMCDRQATFGPLLPSVAPEARNFVLGEAGESADHAVYILPWGPGIGLDQEACAAGPEVEQSEALSLIHAFGAARALLLVTVQALTAAGVAGLVSKHAALIIVVLSTLAGSGAASLLTERLRCGKLLQEVLVGPLPLLTAGKLLTRPLALWAAHGQEEGKTPAGGGGSAIRPAASLQAEAETICVALRVGRRDQQDSLMLTTLLAEVYNEGLAVVGVRAIFPDESTAQTASSAGLRSTIRAGHPLLLLAIRGPHALAIWRSMLGPSDPELARRTDPTSLNARFGGEGRSDSLAHVPPSSSARAFADVVWAFGGRIDKTKPDGLPELAAEGGGGGLPVPALSVASPTTFAVRLSGRLSFATVGTVLSGALLRMGRIVSLVPSRGQGKEVLTVVAVREGGGSFLGKCTQMLAEPSLEMTDNMGMPRHTPTRTPTGGASLRGSLAAAAAEEPAIATELCELPQHRGLDLKPLPRLEAAPALEEVCRLGEPEVLVLGLRPVGASSSPLLLRHVLEDLHGRFGPDGCAPTGRPLSAGLDVGGTVELLALRVLDFGVLGGQQASSAASEVLMNFRNFQQLQGRASREAAKEWWLPRDAGGFCSLICLRGEGLLSRFANFLSREWRLPAATAGDVFYTPSIHDARQAYLVFFGGLGAAAFQPSLPCSDLRSILRFGPLLESSASGGDFALAERQPDLRLSEAVLFPKRISPELTVALLLPPKLDTVLFRTLTSCDQHNFTLVAAVIAGSLKEATAKVLFDQEVADDHLELSDWAPYCAAVGRSCESTAVGEEDEQFQCMWLVLSRHQAVKKLAQLCGHSDPAVNQEYLVPSLRAGRDRVQNGIRCATSVAHADFFVSALAQDVGPELQQPPRSVRSLGIEESRRTLECTLLALALVSGTGLSLARVLRDFYTAAIEQGLAVVGLHALDPAGAAGNTCTASGAAWPCAPLEGQARQLMRWRDVQPAAAAVAGSASEGCRVIFAACEGLSACEHGRRVMEKLVSALPKSSVEWYASRSVGEGAKDVALFFGELHGAAHYVIDGGAT